MRSDDRIYPAAKPGEIEVLRASAAGENILKAGEDVAPGQISYRPVCACARLRLAGYWPWELHR